MSSLLFTWWKHAGGRLSSYHRSSCLQPFPTTVGVEIEDLIYGKIIKTSAMLSSEEEEASLGVRKFDMSKPVCRNKVHWVGGEHRKDTKKYVQHKYLTRKLVESEGVLFLSEGTWDEMRRPPSSSESHGIHQRLPAEKHTQPFISPTKASKRMNKCWKVCRAWQTGQQWEDNSVSLNKFQWTKPI